MTKADIVERIYEKTSLPKKYVADILEDVFDVMKTILEKGENLKISGFGNFEVRQKQDRTGRNPQTGESMIIKARNVLSFRPSKLLRDGINK